MRLNKGKQAVGVGILTGGNKKLTTIYFEQNKPRKINTLEYKLSLSESRHEYHVVMLLPEILYSES